MRRHQQRGNQALRLSCAEPRAGVPLPGTLGCDYVLGITSFLFVDEGGRAVGHSGVASCHFGDAFIGAGCISCLDRQGEVVRP